MPYDSVMAIKPLEVKVGVASELDPDKNVTFSFDTPLAKADTAGMHLYAKHDTLGYLLFLGFHSLGVWFLGKNLHSRIGMTYQHTRTVGHAIGKIHAKRILIDVVLRAFTEPLTDRYFLKAERKVPNCFSLYFSYGDSILPEIKGLNFDAEKAFIIESSEKKDSITYWLRDTALASGVSKLNVTLLSGSSSEATPT